VKENHSFVDSNIVEIAVAARTGTAKEGSFALAYPLSRHGFDSGVASP
jgi:hypothetical protein